MTEFERKKISQESIGDKLRKLREEAELSVDDIVSKTKIRRKYIVALESGDWAQLPSPVYTRGFVASYASVVGGNRHSLVRGFERELGVSAQAQLGEISSKKAPYMVSSANMRKHRVTVTSRWLWWIGAVVTIGGLIFYLYSTYATFVAEPLLIITSPATNATVENPDLLVTGRATASATITINNQPVIVNADGQFQGRTVLSPGVNAITVIATNRFDKITQSIVMVEFRDSTPIPTPEFELNTDADIDVEGVEIDQDQGFDKELNLNPESEVSPTTNLNQKIKSAQEKDGNSKDNKDKKGTQASDIETNLQ